MNRRFTSPIVLATIASLTFVLPASAEVSDKVITIPEMWWWSVPGALAAFFAWRYRTWTGLIVSAVALHSSVMAIATVLDEYVGPAIRTEQGWPYVASAFGSFTLVLAFSVAGALLRRVYGTKVPA
jgi:hypothetical protein